MVLFWSQCASRQFFLTCFDREGAWQFGPVRLPAGPAGAHNIHSCLVATCLLQSGSGSPGPASLLWAHALGQGRCPCSVPCSIPGEIRPLLRTLLHSASFCAVAGCHFLLATTRYCPLVPAVLVVPMRQSSNCPQLAHGQLCAAKDHRIGLWRGGSPGLATCKEVLTQSSCPSHSAKPLLHSEKGTQGVLSPPHCTELCSDAQARTAPKITVVWTQPSVHYGYRPVQDHHASHQHSHAPIGQLSVRPQPTATPHSKPSPSTRAATPSVLVGSGSAHT